MSDAPAPIAVMLSGSGRTLVNLCERIDAGDLNASVVLAIASKECVGAQRARERGIPTIVEPGVIDAQRLEAALTNAGAEWLVLAGYLKLVRVPPRFQGRVLNIHPALLPAFGGPGMYGDRVHRAVLEHGCRIAGCTVHLCDDRYDTGPIVIQKACEVRDDDTPETLAARVFELEKAAYPEAIAALIEGRIIVEGRRTRILPRSLANRNA
ncbi:MAG: phosphoribosylglycinamide formyltransferase [Phycisphaerales bacterium]